MQCLKVKEISPEEFALCFFIYSKPETSLLPDIVYKLLLPEVIDIPPIPRLMLCEGTRGRFCCLQTTLITQTDIDIDYFCKGYLLKVHHFHKSEDCLHRIPDAQRAKF